MVVQRLKLIKYLDDTCIYIVCVFDTRMGCTQWSDRDIRHDHVIHMGVSVVMPILFKVFIMVHIGAHQKRPTLGGHSS